MSNLFKIKQKKSNKRIKSLTIKLDDEIKDSLAEIFNNRTNYYQHRLDCFLNEAEMKTLDKNIWDMFNYSLTNLSLSNQVDFKTDKSFTFNAIINDIEKTCYLNNYPNLPDKFKTQSELKEAVLEQIIKDYSVAVKYCTIGAIAIKGGS